MLHSYPTRRSLIAPAWHTVVFIAIFLGISVVGGFFQHAVKQHPQAVVPSGNAVPRYISVLVFEWLLVLYVRMGVHKRGVRLRDLVGGRWATPKDVLRDIALGAGLWALWIGLMNPHILGGGTNAAQGLLPQGMIQSLAWIPLALSAGFVRNWLFVAIFRINFRRSLAAASGQSLSKQSYLALDIYTKGSARWKESRYSASCLGYSPSGERV